MPLKSQDNAHLLVEGNDDLHVISVLCEKWKVFETFDILTPEMDDRIASGIDQLFENFRVHLKGTNKRAIGIVIDADSDLSFRWQQLKDLANEAGYTLPQNPSLNGTIIPPSHSHLPKIGIWIMPNNQATGELEDFVSWLIPDEDELIPHAENVLNTIEADDLARYRHKRSKAFVHTWLAWQENPGMPMGKAITAKALSANSPIAQTFVDWLNRLFNA